MHGRTNLPSITLWGILFLFSLGWAWKPAGAAPNPALSIDGRGDTPTVRWEEAYKPLIVAPDRARLERGEILRQIEEKNEGRISAQTVGLIKARPEECFRVISDYNNYKTFMPYTVESRVLRSFLLHDKYQGLPAVDFWTRIRVWGISTRYLIRIVHIPEPEKQRFRIFWTLVDHPEDIVACRDEKNRPCANDLAVNIGFHLLEPFPGNPLYTLHTYTLEIAGKGGLRRSAVLWDKGRSMEEITQAVRKVLEK